MSWVDYRSDDDVSNRRASWRRHDDSDSSDSAKKGLRKASHRAKNQVKAATNDAETFTDSRKPQIVIAAAIAAGLAIAGLVVSKVRGTKDRTAGSDREAVPPSESEGQLSAATQPKKLAARRKRSGYVPEWFVFLFSMRLLALQLCTSHHPRNTLTNGMRCRLHHCLCSSRAVAPGCCLRRLPL